MGIDYMSKTQTTTRTWVSTKIFAKIEATLKERRPYEANTTNLDEQTANAFFSQNRQRHLGVGAAYLFF